MNKTMKKIENPDGGYSIEFYFNGDEPCEEEQATEILVQEFDSSGKMYRSVHLRKKR